MSQRGILQFLLDKFDPTKASRLFPPVCINGVATCAAGTANSTSVDPAVLASGVPLTTANTLIDLYVGRLVPNSGISPMVFSPPAREFPNILSKITASN